MKMQKKNRLAGLIALVMLLGLLGGIALPAHALTKAQIAALPRASAYDAADPKPAYKIVDNADLNAVAAAPADFGKEVALYLTADIALEEGDAARSALGCHASIDGQGHKISGARVNGAGWMAQNYEGAFLRNLKLEDWRGSKTARDTGLLAGLITADTCDIENIEVHNCYISAGQYSFGLLVGAKNPTAAGEILRFKNITVTESEINVTAYGHDGVGFLLGRVCNNHPVGTASYGAKTVFENIYLYDNKITGSAAYQEGNFYHQAIGIVAGRLHSYYGDSAADPASVFKNVAVFNTDITVSAARPITKAVLMGGVGGANYVSAENIVAMNNDAEGLLFGRDNAESRIAVTNAAVDTAYLEFGAKAMDLLGATNSLAAEEIKSGAAVYQLNTAYDHQWAIKRAGEKFSVVKADAENAAAAQVTLQVTRAADQALMKFYLYSDSEGALIGVDPYQDLAAWRGKLDKSYTKDTIVAANHSCRRYAAVADPESAGEHTYTCKHPLCGHVLRAQCARRLIAQQKASCLQSGYSEYYCYMCDTNYRLNVTEPSGAHSYAAHRYRGWSGKEFCNCTACDDVLKLSPASGARVEAALVTAAAADGAQTLEIPLELKENPGLGGLQLRVTLFDAAGSASAELAEIKAGDLFDFVTSVDAEDESVEVADLGKSFLITAASIGEVTADGVVATLVLNLKNCAARSVTGVAVEITDAPNAVDGGQVALNAVCGAAEITKVLKGDLNDDGKASITDAVFLLRYLAEQESDRALNARAGDMDASGSVTTADMALLMKSFQS